MGGQSHFPAPRFISSGALHDSPLWAGANDNSQSEFDHAIFMEDADLFASIVPIRINNIETKRQPIRQVVPECPAFLPAASR